MAKSAEELAEEARRLEIKGLIGEALDEWVAKQSKTRTGTGEGEQQPPAKRTFLQELFG